MTEKKTIIIDGPTYSMHPSSTWMAQQHTIRALGSQQSSQGIERQTPPGRSSEGITVARLAAIQQGSSLADEFHGWGISCMIAILRKRRLCVLFFSERAITYIFGQTYIPASSFDGATHTRSRATSLDACGVATANV
jgi:predicted metal-binding protein